MGNSTLSTFYDKLSGYWDWIIPGNRNFLHSALRDFLGYSGDDSGYEANNPELQELELSFNAHINSKGTLPFEPEMQLTGKTGDKIWVQLVGRVIEWSDTGEALRMVGFNRDISRQKQNELSLKISEQQFKSAFENTHNGMALVSLDGHWLKVNKQLSDMLGYTEEEFLHCTFQDITHPEDLSSDLKLMEELIAGKIRSYQLEKRYFDKKGKVVWILLSVSLVKDLEGKALHFVSQIADINELKEKEEELKKLVTDLKISDERWKYAIEGSEEGIWDWNVQTGEMFYNDVFAKLLGYEYEEMAAVFAEGITYVHEEDREETVRLLQEHLEGRSEEFNREHRIVRKDGSFFWGWGRGKVMIRAKDGSPLRMIGSLVNINAKKEKDEEFRNYVDIISEQNKRLINFAHIVTHNLRSHSGNFEMILNLMQEVNGEEKEELFALLCENSKGFSETINHLNEVVSIQTNIKTEKQPIALLQYIKKTIDVLSGELNAKNIQVINNVPPTAIVNYNPAYMESILLNFISNAVKYSSDTVEPIIKFDFYYKDNVPFLDITDNGRGIDMKRHGHKLFGMYNTFHGNSDAKGIGLFITKSQIEAMGGHVEVESEVGKGSTFKISLA